MTYLANFVEHSATFADFQIRTKGAGVLFMTSDWIPKMQACTVTHFFPEVRAAARTEGKAPDGTPMQLFGYFIERCSNLLAIALAFSPIGDAWRARLRQFPSLVNCCTIDWFTEWPVDALKSVRLQAARQTETQNHLLTTATRSCSSGLREG